MFAHISGVAACRLRRFSRSAHVPPSSTYLPVATIAFRRG
jgi:hypothetical protein